MKFWTVKRKILKRFEILNQIEKKIEKIFYQKFCKLRKNFLPKNFANWEKIFYQHILQSDFRQPTIQKYRHEQISKRFVENLEKKTFQNFKKIFSLSYCSNKGNAGDQFQKKYRRNYQLPNVSLLIKKQILIFASTKLKNFHFW